MISWWCGCFFMPQAQIWSCDITWYPAIFNVLLHVGELKNDAQGCSLLTRPISSTLLFSKLDHKSIANYSNLRIYRTQLLKLIFSIISSHFSNACVYYRGAVMYWSPHAKSRTKLPQATRFQLTSYKEEQHSTLLLFWNCISSIVPTTCYLTRSLRMTRVPQRTTYIYSPSQPTDYLSTSTHLDTPLVIRRRPYFNLTNINLRQTHCIQLCTKKLSFNHF